MEIFFTTLLTIFMGVVALYSAVIVHEKKTGKIVVLPWEKKDVELDKYKNNKQ
tara:strand:+ start:94 stop:252 length:159 start_codon:yes stop_codon:yes gene_type:complete